MKHEKMPMFGTYQEVYVPEDECDAAMLEVVAFDHIRCGDMYKCAIDSRIPLFWYVDAVPGTHLIEVEFHDGIHEPIKARAFIVHEDAARPYLAWEQGLPPYLKFSDS